MPTTQTAGERLTEAATRVREGATPDSDAVAELLDRAADIQHLTRGEGRQSPLGRAAQAVADSVLDPKEMTP